MLLVSVWEAWWDISLTKWSKTKRCLVPTFRKFLRWDLDLLRKPLGLLQFLPFLTNKCCKTYYMLKHIKVQWKNAVIYTNFWIKTKLHSKKAWKIHVAPWIFSMAEVVVRLGPVVRIPRNLFWSRIFTTWLGWISELPSAKSTYIATVLIMMTALTFVLQNDKTEIPRFLITALEVTSSSSLVILLLFLIVFL